MRIFSAILALTIVFVSLLSYSSEAAATLQLLTPTLQPQFDHQVYAPIIFAPPNDSATPTPLITQLHVNERLSWYNLGQIQPSTNVIVVMDYSNSMEMCWETNTFCPVGSRRIDYALIPTRQLIQELLVEQAALGADHQMAYIIFGEIQQEQYSAEIQVPLTTKSSLFWEQIGSPTAPITIPNQQLKGYTATPMALQLANDVIANARTTDKNGYPVTNIVVLLTDGIPNVLIDAPYQGRANHQYGPFGANTPIDRRGPDWQPCVQGPNVTDEPFYQMQCPRDHLTVRSPIQAAIDYGDLLRASEATVWALPIGTGMYSNINATYLPLIADHTLTVTSTIDIEKAFGPLLERIAAGCKVVTQTPRPATGASISIYDANNQLIIQTTVANDGSVALPMLAQGQYYLSASHLDVVAPDDPVQIARDYAQHWLLPVTSGAAATQPFTVGPNQPTRLEAILVSAEPVQCP